MKLSEIFYSIQGEGLYAGVPSVFIRLAGCPYDCRWCDTPYAIKPADSREMTVEQVFESVKRNLPGHAVVTGGEPFITDELCELTSVLKNADAIVTIETSAPFYLADLECDLLSISPKLSNSLKNPHEKVPFDPACTARLMKKYDCQLKFVVEKPIDIVEINSTLDKLPQISKDRIMLMPCAANRDEYLKRAKMVADICLETGFRFCPRHHIMLWGNKRGK